ncbi:MAG: gephyrin-like molybdotransferase Glp, partial [Rhodothermia bacterium]
MISISEARDIVLENTSPCGSERVDIGDATGRILAEQIVAHDDIPPFDNSAMDGYAVLSDDFSVIPVELRIIEDVPAGSTPQTTIIPGTCARIMTGAQIPPGADSVTPVEWTSGFGNVGESVSINRAPVPGQHVRRVGEDVTAGTSLFGAGTAIRASMIGTLASLGYGRMSVALRPTVSVVATGSELVEPGKSLSPGQIRNSNGPGLASLARSAGADVIFEQVARDDYDETIATLRSASEADILIVSGGVSVGSHDFVKEALDQLGANLLFWRVRQKPGKPLLFGMMNNTLVFGLPGNPVSSTVCFYQYVYPAIARFLGADIGRLIRRARLASPITKTGGLHYFVAGQSWLDEEGRLHVRRSGPQGSHVYSSIATADCIIHLDESIDSSPQIGTLVDVEPLPC